MPRLSAALRACGVASFLALLLVQGAIAAPAAAEAPPERASATAVEALETLPVKGRAPRTGYQRTEQFGKRWLDADGNGCDTRNDILRRDLTDLAMQGRCKVVLGTLHDPYTGATIDFVRGDTTSALVQIDHVVALSDAWQKGAQQLAQEQRVALANDPLNLLAVDGGANAAKGAGDAATWLPKHKSARCDYVARQVSVKAAYGLWVTQAEHDAMARVLGGCPDQPLLVSHLASHAGAEAELDEAGAPAETPVPPAETEAPVVPPAPPAYFKNCTAAREAGAAPVVEGQPGYGRHLDRDGDGVGCE
ncbi:GmrSD restriction endonuclease domain-containing protein [Leucobacter sp. gxy201]|uniref:GmrSD restriction endonuclease domain-containing protein n=1 Tax=Leucobacter sp. gxy201 TaxID=2957200 RepID=UPI003DA1814E